MSNTISRPSHDDCRKLVLGLIRYCISQKCRVFHLIMFRIQSYLFIHNHTTHAYFLRHNFGVFSRPFHTSLLLQKVAHALLCRRRRESPSHPYLLPSTKDKKTHVLTPIPRPTPHVLTPIPRPPTTAWPPSTSSRRVTPSYVPSNPETVQGVGLTYPETVHGGTSYLIPR